MSYRYGEETLLQPCLAKVPPLPGADMGRAALGRNLHTCAPSMAGTRLCVFDTWKSPTNTL